VLVGLVDALWNLVQRGGRPPAYWHGEDTDARPYAPEIVRHHESWPGANEPWPAQPWPYQRWPGSGGDGR
jgi:hypothetical protein